MKISRRKFLGVAPLAALSAGMVLELANSVSAKSFGISKDSGDVLSRLGWNQFYPYVTTDFVFRDENGNAVNLRLAKMDDTKPNKYKSVNGECFSLSFRGSRNEPLVQNVYQVEHFALGNFALMITVIGRNGKGFLYEAIINRLEP